MIFIAVGTQKFSMNRLLEYMDELLEKKLIKDEVFAQIGHSSYCPAHYDYANFLSKNQFEQKIDSCELLITHGGVGTIVASAQKRKPIIVVPRLKKYKEHLDDHQTEIASEFEKHGYVLRCDEMANLMETIERAKTYSFRPYESQRAKMLEYLENYIKSI